jgi:manganese transport protein
LTGTLAGQIVMEGFLELRIKPWQRRLLTRAIAIVPAIFIVYFAGENKVISLLILSQVILSFQLPFAIIPLIQFTSERAKMGVLVNSKITKVIGYGISVIIIALNMELIWLTLGTH